MEGMGYNISLVLGSQSNFKITTKYDWKHAKGLLNDKSWYRLRCA